MDNLKSLSKQQLIEMIHQLTYEKESLVQELPKKEQKKRIDKLVKDAFFNMTVNYLPDYVLVVSTELNPRILFLSPSHKNFFGSDYERMIDAHIMDYVHSDDKPKIKSLLIKYFGNSVKHLLFAKADILESFEVRIRNYQNEYEHLHCKAKIIGFKYVLLVSRNIDDRIHYENEIIKLKQNWEDIFMSISSPAAILDPNQRIIKANRATVLKSKLKEEDIIGQPCYTVFHKSDAHSPVEGCPVQLLQSDGQYKTVEMEMEAFDGRYLVNVTPILNKKGELEKIIHIATDVTEQSKIREKLEEEKNLRELIMDATHDSITYYDKDLNLVMMNAHSGFISDLKKENIIGTKCYESFFHRNTPCDNCQVLTCIRENRVTHQEIEIEGRSYKLSYFPVMNSFGEIIGAVEIGAEVTEIRKKEMAVAQSETDLQGIVNNLPDGILILKDATILYINNTGIEMLGLNDMDSILGTSVHEFLPDAFIQGVESMIDQLNNGIVSSNVFIVELTNISGKAIECEVSVDIILYKGEPSYRVVIEDVTERLKANRKLEFYQKEIEKEIDERTKDLAEQTKQLNKSQDALTFLLEDVNDARKELEDANKNLEELNTELESFSYSVSHDLRGPLSRLDGFSKALESKLGNNLDKDAAHYLSRIRASSQYMGQLINDILNLSRISRQEMKFQAINSSNIVKRILDELIEESPDRVHELNIEPDIILHADRVLLEIILRNLCENAWKFTSKQEVTRITYKKIEINGDACIMIKDNGVGFDMNYYDQIFAPFRRLHTDDEFPGTGIGLATVKRIVNRHNGKIWAESVENEETKFYLKLN